MPSTIGPKGLALIKRFEGFRSAPYLCPADVPTIGYGNTYYADGSRVTLADAPISEADAEVLLAATLGTYEHAVATFANSDISQENFDALTSFAYNLGTKALQGSTLLRKVNANLADPSIRAEFMKWTHAAGKVLPGLVTRRNAEADLYFSAP